MGKGLFSFPNKLRRRRQPKNSTIEATQLTPLNSVVEASSSSTVKQTKKKARLWIKFDRFGQSEVHEWDKNTIIRRVSIPARDLRILGPLFSQSSNILEALCIDPFRSDNEEPTS
ncbi:hypothetical protein GIB67_036317 [Kingdonia uniflora]|uniref:Uncharacterized protein n=1 Tax=Kingdonia uniflora TaxID=39325 RepID=A0A7J7L3R0_9MAGN|nr:hypothetical protein GIB67_036317 [Kingdonia uniflora]